MNLLSIFRPLTRIIEKVVPDADLRKQLEAEITSQIFDQNSELMRAQADIVKAEAQGEGFLQRSWRPITMLSFLALIFAYWFGFAPDYVIKHPDIIDRVFQIVQYGLSGYVVGRSGEKIAKVLAQAGGVKKVMGG